MEDEHARGRKWVKSIDKFILAEYPGLEYEGKRYLLAVINAIWGQSFTYAAFKSHVSESGLFPKYKRGGKPLYSEQVKKGYIRIKTPKGWMQKQRWVYEQTHPDYEYKMDDIFIFLDGNRKNFAPENIEKLTRREIAQFNVKGAGVVKGNPELTRLNILRVRCKILYFDKADKLGLCYHIKSKKKLYRYFRKYKNN